MEERPQNKFLSELYDDFFWLISSDPDAFDAAKNTVKKIKYNRENASKFNFKNRKEYIKDAETRAKKQNKTIDSKSSGYFDEYEIEEKDSTSKNIEKNISEKTEKLKEETDKNIKEISKKEKEEKLQYFLKKVDELHLEDTSKLVLKKMIDYARKYDEKIVKHYIPFNMRIYSQDDEILYSIINLIIDSFTYFNYMKNEEAVERSFFVVEEGNHITDLYNNFNSLVVFKDVDGLLNKDTITRNKLLNIWEDVICDYSSIDGITTIIVDKDKEKIDELFSNNSTLKDKIFDFELSTTSFNIQEIYQDILKILKKDYIVTGEFEVKLLDYITETFKTSNLTPSEYENSLIEKILFNQTENIIEANSIPTYEKNKTIDEIFEDLNSLIGLDNIKESLKELVSFMQFKNKTKDSLNIKNTNLHMVFLGNLGTGKTTVARMVSGILYNLKYIKQNKLIEVSAKDLIGQYVGQTAPKTMSVVEKALGGVLFIDEAYSLASSSSGNSFNEECVSTLIQAMENYRNDFVVIFAGYKKEMDAFLKSNSGIISRIGYTLDFKDYTIDELVLILKSMFKKSGFLVEKNAIIKAKKIIEDFAQTENFGNARFVRNLYEKTIIKHAKNTKNTTSKKALKTITTEDLSTENLMKF